MLERVIKRSIWSELEYLEYQSKRELGDGVVQGREDYMGIYLQPVNCIEPSV